MRTPGKPVQQHLAPWSELGPQLMDYGKKLLSALSIVPGIGDAAGGLSDLAMYATEPESRTPGNFALSLAGLLPFVPPAAGLAGLGHIMSGNAGPAIRALGPGAQQAGLFVRAEPTLVDQAKALLASGRTPEEVWQTLGVGSMDIAKGIHPNEAKNWLREIDDSLTKVSLPKPGDIKHLDKAVRNPELPPALLEGGRLGYQFIPSNVRGAGFMATQENPIIALNTMHPWKNAHEKKQVALHEVQHVLQQRLGLPGGGRPEDIGYTAYKHLEGEALARMVERRAALDALARRENYPFQEDWRYGIDIPPSQLNKTFK